MTRCRALALPPMTARLTLIVCLAALVATLAACDSATGADPRTTDTQRVRVDGYELRGVFAQREADGSTRYLLRDAIEEVVRFTALPRLTAETSCSPAAELCVTQIVGRPTDVSVRLSRPVGTSDGPLPAGEDLAFALSEPDRTSLLEVPPSVPDSPQPERFVALDPTKVAVPAGELTLAVEWTTADPDVSYRATRSLVFTP